MGTDMDTDTVMNREIRVRKFIQFLTRLKSLVED